MEKRYYSIISINILPGILASILIIIITSIAFFPLFLSIFSLNFKEILLDKYLLKLLKFSLQESFLSTVLSVFPALFISKSLYKNKFYGRNILLKICSITFMLPSLVAILGILNIYGREGLFSHLLNLINIKYNFSLYGLKGIILVHVFFNMPLAVYLFFNTLKDIPIEQRYLASQLNMKYWNYFIFLEWPFLKKQFISVSFLIFILCFNSLSIILTFGGNVINTTLALAIFHNLHYDYNLSYAAFLTFIHMFICVIFLIISEYFGKKIIIEDVKTYSIIYIKNNFISKVIDIIIIIIFTLIILLPIISLIFDGININIIYIFKSFDLWKAIFISIKIALLSSLLCLMLTLMLLWTSRELFMHNYFRYSKCMESIGIIILIIPNIALSTGLFLTFNYINFHFPIEVLLIFINAFMALPYSVKILKEPIYNVGILYNTLCLSLNITGWNRLKLIEYKLLYRSIAKSLTFSSILSIGDFDSIVIFGNQNFCTLSCYFYQQFNFYNTKNSSCIALIFMLLCFMVFFIFEKISKFYAYIK